MILQRSILTENQELEAWCYKMIFLGSFVTKYLHDNEKPLHETHSFGTSIYNAYTAALKNKVVNRCRYSKSPRGQWQGSLNHWISGKFQVISLLSHSSLRQRGRCGSSIFRQNLVQSSNSFPHVNCHYFHEFYYVLSTKHSPWAAEIYPREKTLNSDSK